MNLSQEQKNKLLKGIGEELRAAGIIGPDRGPDPLVPVRCVQCHTGTVEVQRSKLETDPRICAACREVCL